MVLAFTAALAWPLLPVVTVAPLGKVAPAPLPGPAKVTLAPDSGLLKWSSTVTTSGLVKLVLTVVVWPEPEVTTMLAAASGVLVKVNEAGVLTPVAVAVTL